MYMSHRKKKQVDYRVKLGSAIHSVACSLSMVRHYVGCMINMSVSIYDFLEMLAVVRTRGPRNNVLLFSPLH